MKIGNSFSAFNISASGLSAQRKKMNIIAENIANADVTKTDDGGPFQRQFLSAKQTKKGAHLLPPLKSTLPLNLTKPGHLEIPNPNDISKIESSKNIKTEVVKDDSLGEVVYMPEHPDADENGYVQMPNVNIVTEMVDMIAATRSYDANLTALNASKQMAKDSLEI